MNGLELQTLYGVVGVLFWYLFPGLKSKKANEHENNTPVGV